MTKTLVLGPRACSLTDQNGVAVESFELSFELKPNSAGPITGQFLEFTGEAVIRGAHGEDRIQVYATDELQLLGRLMMLSMAFFEGVRREEGLRLSTSIVSDVTSAAELFR